MQTKILKKYTFRFNGRQTGAIGIFYNITDTYEANNLNEAVAMLYTDYEHIRLSKATENSKPITEKQFNAAVHTNTKVDYKGKGMARK